MFGRIFDWLSNLRPRQLFLLAAAAAIIIFCIMYIGLKTFSKSAVPLPINIGQEEQLPQAPAIKMKSVVVATRNIEAKSMILGSMLETKEFPEDALPLDAVTDVADIANKPAKVRIMMGEVITHQKVYRNIEQSGFVGSIPPDCRAVSINLNDVTGVAGFAKPGDYVDVLLIETTDDVVTSRLILQNVLLLSINKSMNADQAPPPPQQQQQQQGQQQQPQESTVNPATQAIQNPALATLALRPDEVLQLVSASKIGEIYLMLRPLVPQSDYYNGAEYTIESIKAQRERVEAEEAAQTAKSLVEAVTQAQNPNKNVVSQEPRIEIMYGNKEQLEDTNQTVPASQDAASQNNQSVSANVSNN